MTKFKKYPKYKDSGIEWLGEIPEHWISIKPKTIGYLYGGLKNKKGDDFKVEKDNFKAPYVPFTNIANNLIINPNQLDFVKITPNEEQNEVGKGDLLFLMSSENFEDIGKTALVNDNIENLYLNSFCKGLRITDENINSNFLNYLFLADVNRKRLSNEARGFTRINLKIGKVNDLELALPNSLSEQTAIANFLDYKLSQINRFIKKKKQLVQLLNEKKEAIINEYVTGKKVWASTGSAQGEWIKPEKVKDSGIEWLGVIPEDWKVRKLKYFVSKIGSGITPKGGSESYVTEGIPFLRSQNVHFDGLRLDNVAFIPKEIHESMSNTALQQGDVLLNITGASIGRACFIPEDFIEGNVNQHVCIIRPTEKIYFKFLALIFRSHYMQYLIQYEQVGASREALNQDEIKNMLILYPLMQTQHQIVDKIESETAKIDATISKIEKELELVEEYKTALIAEAVTGKIDVRDVVIPEWEVDEEAEEEMEEMEDIIDDFDK